MTDLMIVEDGQIIPASESVVFAVIAALNGGRVELTPWLPSMPFVQLLVPWSPFYRAEMARRCETATR